MKGEIDTSLVEILPSVQRAKFLITQVQQGNVELALSEVAVIAVENGFWASELIDTLYLAAKDTQALDLVKKAHFDSVINCESDDRCLIILDALRRGVSGAFPLALEAVKNGQITEYVRYRGGEQASDFLIRQELLDTKAALLLGRADLLPRFTPLGYNSDLRVLADLVAGDSEKMWQLSEAVQYAARRNLACTAGVDVIQPIQRTTALEMAK
jgi:hypothetical protein